MTSGSDAPLGAESLAALTRAARLAGDAALVPKLEALVTSYLNDRRSVGTAPRLGRLHQLLRDGARTAEALRRVLDDPWQRQALDGAPALIRLDLDHLERDLA
jgi:hypothetical protein